MKTLNLISKQEALKNANSTINQDIKSQFIGKHVYANVGTMVENILKYDSEGGEAIFSYDDIENLYSYPEHTIYIADRVLSFEGGSEEDLNTFKKEFEALKEELEDFYQYEEQFEDAVIELESLEAESQEIFEWWIVSNYLIEKLAALGHPVLKHENIWGRCTTGQAILLDYAISQICAEMDILDGQSNSWAKDK